MLVLYDSKATLFDTLGLGILRDIKSDPIITEELNGAYTLEFEYAVKGHLSDKLIEGNIVKANSQVFRIWNITKNINTIKILAKHIFFDLSKNFIDDVAPSNLSAQGALEWILKRTQYNNNFTVSGSCSELASARYVEKNVIDAIFNEDNAILKRFGGELELDNYNIYIHSKRGNNTNFSIRYGKNLSGIDFNLDFSTVVTRICPQGKDDLHLDKKYVDSPLINNYFMPFYKKMEFDIGIDDNTTEEQAKQNLLEAVKQEFNNGIDTPNISVKVDFIELSKCVEYSKYSNLESCHLGDTVQAIIPTLDLKITTRIVKTVYNCALNRLISLELGNTVPNFVTESNKKDEAANNAIRKINTTDILKQARKDATNIINHPFNGNLYIDENSGTLYLLDTTNPATALCVWKWSLGGLGFSSTGINGDFETAITQDGKIVADFITTGTMAVERIQGLSSKLELIMEDIGNTSEKIMQQEMTTEGVKSSVSSIETTISNELATKEELNTQYQQLNNKFNFTINKAVSDLKNDGVPKVSSKIVTIADNGIVVGASDSEYTNRMDNTGNYQYNAGQLVAKYDKDGAEIPRLKSDFAIIAGLKYTKENIGGITHHKTYVLE